MDDLFYFVDLPGYGYSEMSKAEQAKVADSINRYLAKRDNINLIIFTVGQTGTILCPVGCRLLYRHIRNDKPNDIVPNLFMRLTQ